MDKMNYFDLEVWKKSRSLATLCYKITKTFPREEVFELTAQLRRGAISVVSNLAEGCGRRTSKDTLQFLYISRGSLYELESQCFVAFDLEYLDSDKFNELLKKITECKKLLIGFINYYATKKTLT